MRAILIALLCTICETGFSQDSVFVHSTDSVKLYTTSVGEGQPILFVHGGPGSTSGYMQHAGGAALHHLGRFIYYDQRGSGRSDNAANKNYSLQRMVEDIEDVRKAYGIEKWVLMPHSFGGIIATEYAAKYPERIAGMIYLNATLNIDSSATSGLKAVAGLLAEKGVRFPTPAQDSLPLLQKWFSAFDAMREHGMFYKLMFSTPEQFTFHDSVTQRYASHYEFAQQVWGYPEYFTDKLYLTQRITVPVLVVGGKNDYTIGVKHPELMKFPNKKVVYIPGGHALYLEQPALLAKAIEEYLNSLKTYSKGK